jgi:hypothetical protein
MRFITNNVPRPILNSLELTEKELSEFDYLLMGKENTRENWDDISASFFRYKGQLYDLSQFMRCESFNCENGWLNWDGYHSDSAFSATVVRYVDDYDNVVVGFALC